MLKEWESGRCHSINKMNILTGFKNQQNKNKISISNLITKK